MLAQSDRINTFEASIDAVSRPNRVYDRPLTSAAHEAHKPGPVQDDEDGTLRA